MISKTQKHCGFTLLELMIALAIFSVAALAALKHSSQAIRQQEQLVDKTLAIWLAENSIAEIRLKSPWPDTGSNTTTVTSAKRTWGLSIDIKDTPIEALRKVTVTVQREGDDRILANLTGYLGKH
jgi:general secretion pathway protein I